jgi:anti-sigma B factor antagonist
MNNGPANLMVSVGDKLVCIRISGRASFQSSVDFRTLVTALWQQGHTRFVLELTECQLMDSTFLGVMAGLGLKFSGERNPNGQATLELLNPSERVTDMLDNLGIIHLFKIVRGPSPASKSMNAVEQPSSNPDKKELSRTCLEAHKLLMEINPDNIPKFKDVTRFLEEDIQRQN